MRTLFEISDDLIDLAEQLERAIDDAPEQEALIQEWFDQLEATKQERDQKLDDYAGLIRELEARASTRRAEAQRLLNRARVDENLSQFLKRNLKLFFEQHQIKTIETRRFRLTLARNGGRPPVNLTIPPEELPIEYQAVTVKPNFEALRESLVQGQIIHGASLGARGSQIRIS